jgi:hypothetical protein
MCLTPNKYIILILIEVERKAKANVLFAPVGRIPVSLEARPRGVFDPRKDRSRTERRAGQFGLKF